MSGIDPGVDLRECVEVIFGRVIRRPEIGRRCCMLAAVLVLGAGGLLVTALVARADEMPLPGLSFWMAVAIIALAQFARIPVRVGEDYVLVGWGEVAIIAALCLVPPVWLPWAGALGAMIAHVDRLVGAPPGQRQRVPYAILSLTVATTAAASVASLFTGGATDTLRLHADDTSAVSVLLAAALIYFVVSSLLASAWVADGRGIGTAWRNTARAKRFMLPGNLAVGTAVAVVMAIDSRWLVALVPICAILHQAYLYQARVDEGQDQWENLVYATRELNHLETTAVAAATVRGAARLFGAAEVEVALHRDVEPAVWYRAGRSEIDDVVTRPAGVSLLHSSQILSRKLVVGAAELGEVRLGFDRSRRLSPATNLVFTAFAYAVANALGDAATHHRLQMLAARSAFDAVHDPLTGLANRSMLVARGNAELARRTADAPAALLLLDVDTFRAVNDTLSPAAGDDLLRSIASRLAAAACDGEILARLGGDEFALLLRQDAAAPKAAVLRAKQIAALVASPIEVAGVTIAVTATVGVGLGIGNYVNGNGTNGRGNGVPGDGVNSHHSNGNGHGPAEFEPHLDTTELMRRAGMALRRARREGVPVAEYADVPTLVADRHQVLADLRDALATTDQLGVLLQPVVNLATNQLVGAEVLVRWHHPTRGVLLPADFIAAVEHSELAAGFTGHVIDLALEIAAEWLEQGLDLPVTVNLCARSTLDRELPPLVADRLARHGVAANRLILEITEGIMVADPERVECSVAALRALGVQVSVGDFGTASASLELLTKCRVDEVKIDRTFVAAITTSPETRAIVTATVDIARDLDMRVVAEAVELPEQREALNALGVTLAQGHLFYPPLSADETTTLIRDRYSG
jgi:diguanylate cyclase (GGDEF)-like protein